MVEYPEGTLALAIQDEEGRVTELGLMNEKAYKKSLENGVLWVVHGDTGRVLPYGESRSLKELAPVANGYRAVLLTAEGSGVPEKAGKTAESGTGLPAAGDAGGSAGTVLERLTRVIAERHRQMPEGSYTTHLFKSGPEKIRKKLGEEAVEVILAGTDGDLLSESADLIYHLMVLLESRNLTVNEVLKVLEKRE